MEEKNINTNTKNSFFNEDEPFIEPERALYRKFISFEKLVELIEKLDIDGIISFDEFKALHYRDIKSKYFSFPNFLMVEKAKIKIADKRNGKIGLSELTTIDETFDEGVLVKKVVTTVYF